LTLYTQFRSRNLNGLEVRSFVKDLLKHLRGPVFLFWDRGRIQRREELKKFLSKHRRIHVEFFPSYPPELNPAELVWNRTDRNLCETAHRFLAELSQLLHNPMRRLKASQRLLFSRIYASVQPWKRAIPLIKRPQ
jgi:transposase